MAEHAAMFLLTYLIHAAQRRLFSAGDQMCPNTHHVDLVLLNQNQTEISLRTRSFHDQLLWSFYLPVEIGHALLRDVVGPDDDQRVKLRDGKAV